MTHEKKQHSYQNNNYKTNASITKNSDLFKKKRTREQYIMQDQTHQATERIVVYAGLGKYPASGQEKIKGSKREFHQKPHTITCHYATLEH